MVPSHGEGSLREESSRAKVESRDEVSKIASYIAQVEAGNKLNRIKERMKERKREDGGSGGDVDVDVDDDMAKKRKI